MTQLSSSHVRINKRFIQAKNVAAKSETKKNTADSQADAVVANLRTAKIGQKRRNQITVEP